MKSRAPGMLFGLLFILTGLYLLFENYFYYYVDDMFIGTIIFGIGALFFYFQFLQDRRKWWGLALGSTCLFMAYVFFVQSYFWLDDETIGVAIFWIAGATFLGGFLSKREEWGLIIPAGVSFTLGFVVFSEIYNLNTSHVDGGFYLFLGLAITFGVLYFMSNEKRRLSWAAYPALALFFIAIIIGFTDKYSLVEDFFVPALLIILGLILLFKSVLVRKNSNNNQLQVQ